MEMLPKYGEPWLDLTFPATRTFLIRNYSVVLLDLKWNTAIFMAALKSIPSFTTTHRLETVNFQAAVFFAGFLYNLKSIICGSPHYGFVFAPSILSKPDSTVL
jgi:hypothetical protein